MTLKDWAERFDNVIDSGLFHVFSDEDRRRYVEGLATVLKPSGRLFLMCFSDAEPGEQGPRRVSKEELHAAFAEGWLIESIEPTRAEVRPDFKDLTFSEGGPKAVVRRGEAATMSVTHGAKHCGHAGMSGKSDTAGCRIGFLALRQSGQTKTP